MVFGMLIENEGYQCSNKFQFVIFIHSQEQIKLPDLKFQISSIIIIFFGVRNLKRLFLESTLIN